MTKSLLILAGCTVVFAPIARAIEPWADEQLPVRNGLELWFDCSRQNAGRAVVQLPPLKNGAQADHLIDGSGRGRHLQQPLQDARPLFRQEVNGASLSFEGISQALFVTNLKAFFTNVTVFIVAEPRSNPGDFRAFFSLNQVGQNDYISGLNLDQGIGPTPRFSFVNVEGSGMRGAAQLLKGTEMAFKFWHVFSLQSQAGASSTRLFIDGQAQGARSREDSLIAMDDFVLGGRHYSNKGGPPYIQGFFDGGVAEFLFYGRSLTDDERVSVEQYLAKKYASLLGRPGEAPVEAKALVPVSKPPELQMFVPGFTVRPLPLSLKNINNIKYRPDGKLVALGYNGRIYLLTDKDGDGLEEHVEAFWDTNTLRAPIGMALTPPDYTRGQGVFVAAKGKVSLIVDTNGDDRADEELIVATGWKEIPHGVDALGVAMDAQGNLYFGLGAADYTNPYLVDKATGQSHYSLASERGTILKVSPDFKHREIVCTGVRFSVALAFNRLGDLFCTDQEGATWLPNGNPFDELLWIQPGRHYGFPPKHPQRLPDVINEPSVFDYAPQHQSTCGLNFNEPVNGGPVFGPSWWAGDAFVCGYSRGKIYRTKLVKTADGYVAENQQIASLPALTVDACVSPTGELVVSTHTGPPDWGSGPEGEGHLYKVSYTEKETPQPTLVWSSSPSEIRIAFDRPLESARLRNLAKRVEVTQGKYVSAGDRFEVIRPGYAAVDAQQAEARFDVAVEGTSLTADGRTLILNTRPRQAAVRYGITLSQWNGSGSPVPGGLSQFPDVDLVADLAGVEARWVPNQGPPTDAVSEWIPHIDLSVSRKLTEASASHAAFWSRLQMAGTLTLRGQLDLWELLQPAIQPGAKLDYDRPAERATVVFSAAKPFRARFASETKTSTATSRGRQEVKFGSVSQQEFLPFELSIATGAEELGLTAVWFTAEDPRPRVFPLRRLLMPWAGKDSKAASPETQQVAPELTGGNWLRGRKMFFSEPLNCQRCHSIRGEGHHVGPDLSNLVFRDYASVLRDIEQPSATLNPDFLAYNIQLKDGDDDLTGVLQKETPDEITVIDATAHTITVPKSRVAAIKPSTVSFMPEKLLQAVGTPQLKDLMTFLLTLPLEPTPIRIFGEPPPRKEPELEAVLKPASTGMHAAKMTKASLAIVLCAGPKDHGESEHDYPVWQKRWATLLAQDERVRVDTAWEWPKPEQFNKADVVVFYSGNPGWNAARANELKSFLGLGKGVVFVHLALDGHEDPQLLAGITGLAWQSGVSKFRHGPTHLAFARNSITPGFEVLDLVDETYWNLIGDPKDINVIASCSEEGKMRPQVWEKEYGKGRVFVCIPGHYAWTFDDPMYRTLLLRGICWAAGQPPDSLAELISIGARVAN